MVRQITEPAQIDTIFYDTPYYLVPDTGGELAYAILRRAFEETSQVAVATLLFYGRERLAVVSAASDIIRLHTLRFQDEITPRSQIKTPGLPQVAPAQIEAASQALERYSVAFHASDYRSRYTDKLNELVARKAKGLSAPKRAVTTPQTTPNNEVTETLQSLLANDPKSLQD